MGKALFVTGTGTDVGKTYVTALIVKKLHDDGQSVGYYKAAMSGIDEGNDAAYVAKIAGLSASWDKTVSFAYKEAVSPHLAAQREGNPLDLDVVSRDFAREAKTHDLLTVEGCGGIVCPLRWDDERHILQTDLIKRLDVGVIVVGTAKLGSINAAVLTVEHLRRHDIDVRGIILNRYCSESVMERDNMTMIEQLTNIPIVATVAGNAQDLDISADVLAKLYD